VFSITAPHARPRIEDLLPSDQPVKPRPPQRRWRYSPGIRALAFLAALLVASVVAVAIGQLPVIADAAARHWWLIRVTELVVVVLAYLVLLWVEQRRPVELGIGRIGGLGWGLLLGAALLLVVIGILFAVGSYRVVGLNPSYPVIPALVSTGLVAAVAEEIAFRGVLLRLIEDSLGTWAAIAVGGLAFGLVHLSNQNATLWGALAIALEAGLLFSALYVVTRSLWWCMGLHFAWNVLQGPVFGSAVSGSGAASGVLTAQFSGPDWLTGGVFGIEASVVSVTVLTALGVALLVRIQRDGLAVAPGWVRRRRLRAEVL
jgi:Predicted metal-dependent membrane protease